MSWRQRLDRGWRLLGTSWSFAFFGLGGLVLSLTLFPLIRLCSPDRETTRRRIQRSLHHIFRGFVAQMRLLGVMSYEVENRERLAQAGGRLVVANHPTLIDMVLLIALIPEADCIVKQALWRNPFLRWPLAWADYIPNNASAERLVETAAARLRAGRSLIVFPEGTRSLPERKLSMHRGAARIALTAGVEILPVTIVCRPRMLAKDQPWYWVPPRPGHWRLMVGEPLQPADHVPAGLPRSLAARRLTQHFVDYFSRSLAAVSQDLPGPATVQSTDTRPLKTPSRAL